MRDRLIRYGFLDWQADELLKKKKLDTPHGMYRLKGGVLTLDGKPVEL